MLWSKISVIFAMQMVLGWALGRVGIPLLRRLKTGRYDPYIGDRFSADGSEPAFGGAAALIVLTFGISAAAAVCGGGRRLYLACGFITLTTLAGAADDLLTDVFGKNYGANAAAKLGWCYAASFVYLLICRKMQIIETAVLLPFHLGTIDFGALFCPVMAAATTALIYSYKYFNRFGTDGSTCAEGLCAAQIFLAGLLFAAAGGVISDETAQTFGYLAAGAAASSLIWGLAPAKLRSGASGGYFCGAVAAAMLTFCSELEFAMLLLALPAVTDALCSAVQYLVYRKSRKFLLKGSSLHSHLMAKKWSAYKVIVLFSAMTAAAGAGTLAFAAYSEKIILK